MPRKPKRADGPLIIPERELGPEGAVAKVSGVNARNITGPAKVFDSEEAAIEAASCTQKPWMAVTLLLSALLVLLWVVLVCRKCCPYHSWSLGKATVDMWSLLTGLDVFFWWDLRSCCRTHRPAQVAGPVAYLHRGHGDSWPRYQRNYYKCLWRRVAANGRLNNFATAL